MFVARVYNPNPSNVFFSIVNGSDIKKTIEYRCVALYASLSRSAKYCVEVGRLLRASKQQVKGVTFLEEEQWMKTNDDAKRIIEKRILSETSDTKRALQTLKMPSFPMWELYQQIQQSMKDVFKHDTVSKNLTKHLPETETNTGSSYNVLLFLKSLHPPKAKSHSLERSPAKRTRVDSPPKKSSSPRSTPNKKSKKSAVVPSGVDKCKTHT